MALVEIPGYGTVEFPDSMGQDAMTEAARKLTPIERAPGYQGSIERPPPQDLGSGTVPSSGIGDWLMEKLSNRSPLEEGLVPNPMNLVDTNTLGGLAGGILGPAALGLVTGGPVGLMGGITAGAVGAGGLQAAQDYLTQGAIDPARTGAQALIGGAGPVLGKVLSGAGMAGSAIARRLGLLGDLQESALSSGAQMGASTIPQIIADLRSGTSNKEAQLSADFLEQKLTGGQPGLPPWLQAHMAKMQGKTIQNSPSTVPIKDWEAMRADVGDLFNSPGLSKNQTVRDAYRSMMDIVRQEEANGNQAAADYLRNLAENKLLEAMVPGGRLGALMGAGGVIGATPYGVNQLLNHPFAVAGAATVPFAGNAIYQMGKAGTYNPYVGAAGNYALQQADPLLESVMGQIRR